MEVHEISIILVVATDSIHDAFYPVDFSTCLAAPTFRMFILLCATILMKYIWYRYWIWSFHCVWWRISCRQTGKGVIASFPPCPHWYKLHFVLAELSRPPKKISVHTRRFINAVQGNYLLIHDICSYSVKMTILVWEFWKDYVPNSVLIASLSSWNEFRESFGIKDRD